MKAIWKRGDHHSIEHHKSWLCHWVCWPCYLITNCLTSGFVKEEDWISWSEESWFYKEQDLSWMTRGKLGGVCRTWQRADFSRISERTEWVDGCITGGPQSRGSPFVDGGTTEVIAILLEGVWILHGPFYIQSRSFHECSNGIQTLRDYRYNCISSVLKM